jgi:TonB family protein
MSYAALLFCPDEKTSRVLSQVLGDLEFSVEACVEPFATVKRLMAARFDAIVVDCDNEQNAALMFKSVRNSESNQAALTVAVVGDQAGVAKAFRLGANLVLTKPINVEQTKGTLRVARGLLKKGETGKPTAAAAVPAISAPSVPTPAPVHVAPPVSVSPRPVSPPVVTNIPAPAVSFPAKQAAATYNVPAIAASALEVESDPVPQPAPDDAALLESMPEPIQTNPVKNSWPAAAAKAASVVASHSGSAAAAAPAREVTPETKSEKGNKGTSVALETETLVGKAEEYSSSTSASPMFSAGAEEDESGSGGSKTVFIAIAAIFVIAILGYVGYAKFSSHSAPQTPSVPVSSQPVVQPDAIVVAKMPTAAETAAFHASKPSAASTASAPANTQSQTNTSAPKSQKTTDDFGDDRPQPLMVKTESAHAVAPDTSNTSPAPPALDLNASNADGALSGIVSSVPVNVPKAAGQTVKVSQGVSQGLLIKKVPPVYPHQALQAGIQGAVLLEAHIAKDGSITSVKAIKGDAQLSGAAVDAVRQWKYKPYFLDGQPIDIQTQVTVNFRLP